jgi:GNAT superfamily N-acetyltransferase
MEIKTFKGIAIRPHIGDLARLRMSVFHDYPYLYEGSEDYEMRYLATYSASPESLFVLAFDGTSVVGAATAMPLSDETAEVKAPFLAAGIAVEGIFYFGESVLQPKYRGSGIGVAFFEAREAAARAGDRFEHLAFCAVVRPDDHPRRPPDYVPLDGFWRRRGFRPRPDLVTTFSWRDVGEVAESAKPMSFWMKRLTP